MAATQPVIDESQVEEKLLAWRNDPVLYAKERLGVTLLDKHEIKILQMLPDCLADDIPLVLSSGHAMGKDFTIDGIAVLWFAECFGPCKVVMTGPTDRQVKEIMWSELERSYNNRVIKDPFGRLLSCKLELAEDWFVIAFTTKETGEGAGKFQGIHSPRVMIVVSEAQKVDDKIYEQIEGITTSGAVLQVYLGNPLRTTGRFAKMIKDTTHNKVVHLDCHDSINYLEDREVIPGLVSRKWVEDKERKWNADKTNKHPLYRAKVLGQLPLTSIDTVISEETYNKCIDRVIIQAIERGSIGVDPARYGDDAMVISAYKGGRLIDEKSIPKCDAVEGSAEIVLMQKKHFPKGQIAIVVDCDGVGGPFLDFAKNMIPDNLEIVWVEFHGSSTDRDFVHADYHNLRAEAHFFAKDQMDSGQVCLDADEEAKEDMTEAHYFVNPSSGRIQIEDKDDIKERLGRSPNKGDARILGIYGFKYAPIVRTSGRKTSSSMVPSGSAMSA